MFSFLYVGIIMSYVYHIVCDVWMITNLLYHGIAVMSTHYLRMVSIYCRIKSVYLFFVAKMQFLVNILKI